MIFNGDCELINYSKSNELFPSLGYFASGGNNVLGTMYSRIACEVLRLKIKFPKRKQDNKLHLSLL
jgi:hypothetical protein